MKALITQFDNKRLSSTVATPTCSSSCCCCCCCLATTLSSTSLLTQQVSEETKKNQVPHRMLLSVLAALYIPISAGLVALGYLIIDNLFKTCYQKTNYDFGNAVDTHTVCKSPNNFWIVLIAVLSVFSILYFLYLKIRIKRPLMRASLVTLLVGLAFGAEFIIGGLLILGNSTILYIISVPMIVIFFSVIYHRYLNIKRLNSQTPPIAIMQADNRSEGHTSEESIGADEEGSS